MPQPPQLLGSSVTSVSHSVSSSPSHSARGSAQFEIPHTPSKQAGLPTAVGQRSSHMPQWSTLALVFVSHPSSAPLMQSPRPSSQRIPHSPSSHTGVPPLSLQCVVQSPHVSGAPRSASHPSAMSPLQSSNPGSHSASQTPSTQTPLALSGRQRSPHAPQWDTEEPRSASQPLFGSPSQSSKPGVQVGTHSPSSQRVRPCSLSHGISHPPQWPTSVAKSASQPVSASSSQSPKPPAQSMRQPPAVHDGSPLRSLQALPHKRQLSRELRFASQRSAGS